MSDTPTIFGGVRIDIASCIGESVWSLLQDLIVRQTVAITGHAETYPLHNWPI